MNEKEEYGSRASPEIGERYVGKIVLNGDGDQKGKVERGKKERGPVAIVDANWCRGNGRVVINTERKKKVQIQRQIQGLSLHFV